ncbi:hypothetical protein DPMN_082071 [Dreissena polymorpha]|uniref:Uncharacterized protein n=1 Tax=Dreissena polymorpha TaxID=45954 RepID=A0A9D3Y9B4_DREPO|nr:hypothetical protein DPMN_082071 [Dreissena polymorpha]
MLLNVEPRHDRIKDQLMQDRLAQMGDWLAAMGRPYSKPGPGHTRTTLSTGMCGKKEFA